ncbi:MAG: hypothetical protein ABFD54_06460 [Armatimonadota bacterium]|nr:hypothetical protein [bacterium]
MTTMETPDLGEQMDYAKTIGELGDVVMLAAHSMHAKLDISVIPPMRRVAWPAWDGFLPWRYPDEAYESMAVLVRTAGRSDDWLRMGFTGQSGASSYAAEEHLRTWNTRRSKDPDKAAFADDVCRNRWPLVGIDELANRVDGLARYLEKNAPSLQLTGFPETRYQDSFWFHAGFATVYPTRLPVYVLHHASPADTYTYLWPRQPAASLDVGELRTLLPTAFGEGPGFWYGSGFRAYTCDCELVQCVPYPQSALLECFTSADELLIPRLRTKVIEIGRAILAELSSSLTSRNPQSLRHRCVSILTESLDANEFDSLALADYGMTHSLGLGYSALGCYNLVHGGFLSNLITLIGHCEEELAVGRLWQTRQAIAGAFSSAIAFDGFAPVRFWYDEIDGTEDQIAVDRAYEVFHSRASQERAFWDSFRRWMIGVRDEFYTEIFGERVRRRNQPEFEAYMRQMARLAASSVELTGQLPQSRVFLEGQADTCTSVQPTINQPDQGGSRHQFRHWDNYRQVERDGVTYSLSPAQAQAVRVLLEAREAGEQTLSAATLLSRMGELAPLRISEIFRSNDPRKALVKRIAKDSYELNI